MATFIQLSRHQRKFWEHQFAKNHRMNEHDRRNRSKAEIEQERQAELKQLIAQQAQDKLKEAELSVQIDTYQRQGRERVVRARQRELNAMDGTDV